MVQSCFYVLFVAKEVGHGRFPAQGQVHPVKIAGSHSRERQRGFAKRLIGDGACIGASASQFMMTIDHRHSLPERGRGGGSNHAGGASANDDEIKFSCWVFRHLHRVMDVFQFSEGFSVLSITRISTGPFCDSNLRPSCS